MLTCAAVDFSRSRSHLGFATISKIRWPTY